MPKYSGFTSGDCTTGSTWYDYYQRPNSCLWDGVASVSRKVVCNSATSATVSTYTGTRSCDSSVDPVTATVTSGSCNTATTGSMSVDCDTLACRPISSAQLVPKSRGPIDVVALLSYSDANCEGTMQRAVYVTPGSCYRFGDTGSIKVTRQEASVAATSGTVVELYVRPICSA